MSLEDNTYPEFTEGRLNGHGLFDEIMDSIKQHLKDEYNAGRIKGADYSKVYLGSMEAALANTTQYLTSNALLEEQRLKLLAEIDLAKANTDIAKLNLEKAKYEMEYLLPLQKAQLEFQNKKLEAEIPLIQYQIDKIDADIGLVKEQTTGQTVSNDSAQWTLDNLLPGQLNKITAEINLLSQKTKTEISQIADVIDGHPVGGVIGKQIELFEEQRLGFKRDAQHKIAKLYTDLWGLQRTTDDALLPYPSMSAANTHKVLDLAARSAGLTSGIANTPTTEAPVPKAP